MYLEYLADLTEECTNSYQLVQALKQLKNEGHKRIKTRYSSPSIGTLMHEIISMSKMGYSYSKIVDELVYNY